MRTAAAWSVAAGPLRTSPEVLAAVSAPSSLAVDLAEESRVPLIGFLRGDSLNVYTGADRLHTSSER